MFPRAYTLPGFINFNLQRGKTYTWVGSTWDSKINYIYTVYIYNLEVNQNLHSYARETKNIML